MRKLIIVVVAVAVLAGLGWVAYDQNNTLALVNNEKITKQDADKILAQYALLNSTYDKTSKENIDKAVEMLANDRLMVQEAKKRNVAVTDEELKPKVAELRDWLEAYMLSQAAKDKNLNPDDAKLTSTDTAQATGERKRLETGLNTTGATLLDKKLAEQKITFNDISDYIRTQTIIEKLVDKLTTENTVTDEQIKQYYDVNKDYKFTALVASHILVAKEDLAKEILAKLKGGADFKALSDQYNEDEAAKAQGGSLGKFYPGEMDPTFEKAAFSLSKPGDISNVVQTSFGYHIIKLEQREVTPFEEAKPQVQEEMQQTKIMDTMKKIYADAKVKPQSLKDKLTQQTLGQ